MRNAIRTHLRMGVRAAGILIVSSLLGLLLLVMVYNLPGRWRMIDNLQQSVLTFENEQDYPMTIRLYAGTQKDNYTDAVMISNALYSAPDQSALDKALQVYREQYSGTLSHSLSLLITGYTEEIPEVVSYGRYWHGYLVFLRPLLMLMGYEDIRACIAMLQYGLAVAVLIAVYRQGLKKVLIPLVAGLLTITPLGTQVSIQFLCVYVLALGGAWLMLEKHEWLHRKASSILYFYLLLGILTSYFDFFTYPMVTLCFSLFFELFFVRTETAKASFGILLRAGVMWAVGYFGMWVSKWVWGTLLTDDNFFADAVQAAMGHVSRDSAAGTFSRWDALILNFKDLSRAAYGILYALCIGSVLWTWKRNPVSSSKMAIPGLTLLGVALIPMVWIMVTYNHAYIHHFFTHKDLSICVVAILSIPALVERKNQMQTQSSTS